MKSLEMILIFSKALLTTLPVLAIYNVLGEVAQGGFVLLLFVIWFYTHQRGNQQYDNSMKHATSLFQEAENQSRALFKISLDKHEDLNRQLIKQMERQQEIIREGHEVMNRTTAVLTRIETKIPAN